MEGQPGNVKVVLLLQVAAIQGKIIQEKTGYLFLDSYITLDLNTHKSYQTTWHDLIMINQFK